MGNGYTLLMQYNKWQRSQHEKLIKPEFQNTNKGKYLNRQKSQDHKQRKYCNQLLENLQENGSNQNNDNY